MFKESEFRTEIVDFVSLVSALSVNMTWGELAEKSGLSRQTINKLIDCKTKSPHYKTLFKLGRAVGLKATLSRGKIMVEADARKSKVMT